MGFSSSSFSSSSSDDVLASVADRSPSVGGSVLRSDDVLASVPDHSPSVGGSVLGSVSSLASVSSSPPSLRHNSTQTRKSINQILSRDLSSFPKCFKCVHFMNFACWPNGDFLFNF
uniref:Uncharacterized protein n=1 Tax=Cacopsylla melanoneura TaxID=428564 RepID=A0A8D8SY98_9HEMI